MQIDPASKASLRHAARPTNPAGPQLAARPKVESASSGEGVPIARSSASGSLALPYIENMFIHVCVRPCTSCRCLSVTVYVWVYVTRGSVAHRLRAGFHRNAHVFADRRPIMILQGASFKLPASSGERDSGARRSGAGLLSTGCGSTALMRGLHQQRAIRRLRSDDPAPPYCHCSCGRITGVWADGLCLCWMVGGGKVEWAPALPPSPHACSSSGLAHAAHPLYILWARGRCWDTTTRGRGS
jgi:hypothetical protein